MRITFPSYHKKRKRFLCLLKKKTLQWFFSLSMKKEDDSGDGDSRGQCLKHLLWGHLLKPLNKYKPED